MGDLVAYRVLTHADSDFYPLLGPFLARREIAREMGPPLEPIWDDDGKIFIVAQGTDGTVLGFATMLLKSKVVQLCDAYVLPAYRRQGIHNRLIDERLARCPVGITVRVLVCVASAKHYLDRGFIVLRQRGKLFTELTKTMEG